MKKALVLSLVLATTAVLSTGCASQGNQSLKKETEATVKNKIVEGKTTKDSVKTMFGSPTETSFRGLMANGTKTYANNIINCLY